MLYKEDKTAIVIEDYNEHLYLESIEKGKYEPIRIRKQSVVLGTMADSCNYTLMARGISRMHAKLMEKADGLYLLDLNSTNGTYLNGEMIESGQDYKLEEGDMVAFALSEFFVARETEQRQRNRIENEENYREEISKKEFFKITETKEVKPVAVNNPAAGNGASSL